MVKRYRLTPKRVQRAIKTIAKHRLGERLDAMDGNEAHRILPEIWPVIRELRLLADACEKGKLQVTL